MSCGNILIDKYVKQYQRKATSFSFGTSDNEDEDLSNKTDKKSPPQSPNQSLTGQKIDKIDTFFQYDPSKKVVEPPNKEAPKVDKIEESILASTKRIIKLKKLDTSITPIKLKAKEMESASTITFNQAEKKLIKRKFTITNIKFGQFDHENQEAESNKVSQDFNRQPSKENDSEKIQQILFNPKSRIMERIRRFEADMKKFGNPNNPKEKLNLNEIPSDMAVINQNDVFIMGLKYGLVGHNNSDYDLMWIAREALLNRLSSQDKESILKSNEIDLYFVYLLRSQRIKKNQEIKELLQKELEFSEIDQNSLTNYDSVQYDDFRRKIIEKYIEERSWMKFVKFEHKGVCGINKIQYYFNFMNKQICNELKQNEKINESNTFDISTSQGTTNSKLHLSKMIETENSLPSIMSNLLISQKNCSVLEKLINSEINKRKDKERNTNCRLDPKLLNSVRIKCRDKMQNNKWESQAKMAKNFVDRLHNSKVIYDKLLTNEHYNSFKNLKIIQANRENIAKSVTRNIRVGVPKQSSVVLPPTFRRSQNVDFEYLKDL